MSLKTNGFIFATFLINCLVIGLLVASFVTDHWIVATVKRNSTAVNVTKESHGDINFGLFQGMKHLNPGVGIRSEAIDGEFHELILCDPLPGSFITINIPVLIPVRMLMRDEPNLLNYWLWLGTAVSAGLGAFSSAVAGIAGVIKSAAPKKKRGTLVLLFVSHIAAALSTCLAFICWLVHFLQQLTHNVLIQEDRNQKWYTKAVHLGHSFYFVVASFCLILVNIMLVCVAVHWERRDRRRRRHIVEPPVDEKTHGAIMLY